MRIGKKGFTLVEVIVSLAIMTIVAGSVGAFIVAGNNSYLRGNKELTLQEEAQLAANQMIDLIIDVEQDIKFTPDHADTAVDLDGNTAKDAAGNEITTAHVSELRLVNNENTYMIRWQGTASGDYATANQVYLYEVKNTTDADGNLVVGDPTTATPALMAEHVTSFSVDLSQVKDKRKVILNMTFTYQDRSYEIAETIKLRNDLEKTGTQYAWISGISIKPPRKTVPQGKIQQFTYTLTGDPEAVAEGATWSVTYASGATCKSTISQDGRLQVDEDETVGSDVLVVKCTAKADKNMVAYAYVTVEERLIDSITISPESVEIVRGSSNTTQVFTCVLKGKKAATDEGVNWTLTYKDGTKVTKSNLTVNGLTATLKVADDEIIAKDILYVTCSAVADDKKSATAVVTVSAIKGMFVADLIAGNLRTYQFEGDKIGYCIDLECMTSWADYKNGYPKITDWRVDGSASGYSFTETEDKGNIFKQTLECSYNINKKIRVTATVQIDATTFVYPYIDIQIPDLTSAVKGGTPYIESDQFILYRNGNIKCVLKNYDNTDNVRWEFEDINKDWTFAPSEEEEARAEWEEKSNNDNYAAYNAIKTKRMVGFSQYNAATQEYTFSKGQDGVHGSCYQLFPTATGEKVQIWAKPGIPINQDYLLKLNAVRMDRTKGDSDYVIATTYVLIPACKMFFPNGTRYRDFYQSKGYDFSWDPYYIKGKQDDDGNGLYDYYLRIDMYGIEQGKIQDNPNALSQEGVNVTGSMIATISGQQNTSGTKISPKEAFLGSEKDTSLVHLYIARDEPGWSIRPDGSEAHYAELLVNFKSTDGNGINQTLVIYYHKQKTKEN